MYPDERKNGWMDRGRGPEIVYWPYRWYETNHLSSDKLKFSQLDNLTNLTYELTIFSMSPGTVNMLPYFFGQSIICPKKMRFKALQKFYNLSKQPYNLLTILFMVPNSVNML